jgi:hypothetical protein
MPKLPMYSVASTTEPTPKKTRAKVPTTSAATGCGAASTVLTDSLIDSLDSGDIGIMAPSSAGVLRSSPPPQSSGGPHPPHSGGRRASASGRVHPGGTVAAPRRVGGNELLGPVRGPRRDGA